MLEHHRVAMRMGRTFFYCMPQLAGTSWLRANLQVDSGFLRRIPGNQWGRRPLFPKCRGPNGMILVGEEEAQSEAWLEDQLEA